MLANQALIKAIACTVAAVFAVSLLWWGGTEFFGAKADPRSSEHLRNIAAQINRSIPVMIDQETELLPAEGHEGMLIYNYRLVGYSVSQLDHQKFAEGARQKVRQGACNRPETRDEFLKNGVTLRYSYFDKDKRHIATIDVTPADCGF
jgi:hypothetical protein